MEYLSCFVAGLLGQSEAIVEHQSVAEISGIHCLVKSSRS